MKPHEREKSAAVRCLIQRHGSGEELERQMVGKIKQANATAEYKIFTEKQSSAVCISCLQLWFK